MSSLNDENTPLGSRMKRRQANNFYAVMAAKRFQTLYFELGGITKHLMTGPSGNSEFCFPSSLNVPLGFASGNIEVSGKQNSLFPLGPVIKCLIWLVFVADITRALIG